MYESAELPRALSVNHAYFEDPPRPALIQIVADKFLRLVGAEGMEIEHAVDREFDRAVIVHRAGQISGRCAATCSFMRCACPGVNRSMHGSSL